MPKEDAAAARKKMRKGTHSCFECRRRKIRCIYPNDNPDVCSECFARGSRCIDQEHADPEVVVDHRKNLRERVSRLEALVDSLLEEKTEKSQSDTASTSKTPNTTNTTTSNREYFPSTPLSSVPSAAFQPNAQRAQSDRGHHVPILSVFEDVLNDAEERIKERMAPFRKDSNPKVTISGERLAVSYKNPVDLMDDGSAATQAKKARVKQALLAYFPSSNDMYKIINSNSEWWHTWRRKCSGTSASDETLPQFASKAVAESNIGALGTLLISLGICSDDEREVERYVEAIDRWVLSDDEYSATLEGMECLILKAKWYADVGQPRRAWLAYRKGLMYAELMGLHRKRTSSAAHESIWWSLYHGDRFCSLLLGLPYGISDSHCDLTLPHIPSGPYLAPLIFMNKLAVLAGRVIDRNQGIAEQSFAWALQIDQELEDLWKQLDPQWLEYADLLVDVEGNAAELREKIMAQMVYHQIRVYLHLPFMLKSQSNGRFTYSRTACLNGSREVMRLYQALRTGGVQPLYECKAVDFIAFTAAVLIVIGLINNGFAQTRVSPKEQEADIRLIEISVDIFRRASSEKGGKVALQSAEVLEKMLKKVQGAASGSPDPDCSASKPEMADFVIPYFGTISIRRGDRELRPEETPCVHDANAGNVDFTPTLAADLNSHLTTPNATSDLFTSPSTSANPLGATGLRQPAGFKDPLVSYEGIYNWGDSLDEPTSGTASGTQINNDSLNNFPLPTNNFSWQNMPMDIDQDWSWFLNDGAANAGPPGTGAAAPNPQQQVNDQFAQHGFIGFG